MADEVPDELLVALVQLPALPLQPPEYLAVVQRVIGNGEPGTHREVGQGFMSGIPLVPERTLTYVFLF